MTFDDIQNIIADLRERGEDAVADQIAAAVAQGRRRLPNARAHEAQDMLFRGRRYVVGVGRYDDGSLAEVFIDAAKQSTDAADDACGAALALSLALQYGCPAETIRRAAMRDAAGAPADIIGACLDMLAGADGEVAR